MELGTATATPGRITDGWLEVADLPTGGTDRLPVRLAAGEAEGPTLWVTGGMHGDEVTGIAAAQDCLSADRLADLRGTVVCLPMLNPSGVRLGRRNSAYGNDDPNRSFPYDVDERLGRGVQTRINETLFEHLEATADALVSLHAGWVHETAYTIVERVRYGRDRTRADAAALADASEALADAFGLPVVREYDADVQEAHGLHRSFESAAVNAAGVPAITPELGSPQVVDDRALSAAVTGVHDVMRALDMLPGDPTPNDAAPVPYPVKRSSGPAADRAGIVRHRVDANAVVAPGDQIADVTTPHGNVVETVESERAGYVLGRRHGIAVYEGDSVVSLAVRDDGDRLVERH